MHHADPSTGTSGYLIPGYTNARCMCNDTIVRSLNACAGRHRAPSETSLGRSRRENPRYGPDKSGYDRCMRIVERASPFHCSLSAMKLLTAALLACAITVATASPTPQKRANPQGIDISHYQGTVNFNTVKANGLSFVYIKATEGTCKLSLLLSLPSKLN